MLFEIRVNAMGNYFSENLEKAFNVALHYHEQKLTEGN